jgi:TolB-like protein/DNA-binding winged helix-turn-helix (wHTH) protein/tetratricopeptide (TPR) repeat protein
MSVPAVAHRIRFGVFEFDPVSGDFWKQGVRVRLHGKPAQVLSALIQRPGELVTRKELQERLWPGNTFVEFENGLNNAISRLRETLGDAAENPRFVETVPRRGYRFIAPVQRADAQADPMELPAPARRPRRRWLPLAGLAALLAAAGLWYGTQPATDVRSIAVLPFVTGASDPASADEYVAFGMTDALISELSRSGALRVISQTSTLRYRDARKPLPEIARELRVDAVIEGSVVREGNQVRITVQLIDAASDMHVWSDSSRHDAAGVLAAQAELARSVSGAIHAQLALAPPATPPLPARPIDPRVREAHLKGRYFLNHVTEEDRTRALAFFQQALAIDPAHAPSHAGAADYYILTDSLPPTVAVPRAREHVTKALELDDTLADAHASLGFLHYYADWDWASAERELRRALELDPGHTRARRWYAMYLAAMGRHTDAREQIGLVLDVDPVSLATLDSAAQVWLHGRDAGRLIEQSDRILELHPSSALVYEHQASARILTGDLEGALESLAEGLRLTGRDPLFLMLLAHAQGALGDTAGARRTQDEIIQAGRDGFVPPFLLAAAHLGSRDVDAALEWLERGYDARDSYLVFVNASPWLDHLRGNPRFDALLRRMTFPAPAAGTS